MTQTNLDTLVTAIKGKEFSSFHDYAILNSQGALMATFNERRRSSSAEFFRRSIELNKYGSRNFQLADPSGNPLANVTKSAAWTSPKYSFSLFNNSVNASMAPSGKLSKSSFELHFPNINNLAMVQVAQSIYQVIHNQQYSLAQVSLGHDRVQIDYASPTDQAFHLYILAASLCLESAFSHKLLRRKPKGSDFEGLLGG